MILRAKDVIEAVRYYQEGRTDGAPELFELSQRLEYQTRWVCSYVKMDMLPEIAVALDKKIGEFGLRHINDIDDALRQLGDDANVTELVIVTLISERWLTSNHREIFELYRQVGEPALLKALEYEYDLEITLLLSDHFLLTPEKLTAVKKLPMNVYKVIDLLAAGVPLERIVSLSNQLRSGGLRNLDLRIKAAYEGQAKPLTHGVL